MRRWRDKWQRVIEDRKRRQEAPPDLARMVHGPVWEVLMVGPQGRVPGHDSVIDFSDEAADSRCEAAHAVGDDVDALRGEAGLLLPAQDLGRELFPAVLDGADGIDLGLEDMMAPVAEMCRDPVEIAHQ